MATYARNLSHALKAMEWQVGILHGRPLADRRDPLLQEVGFFDPPSAKPAWRQRLQLVQEWLTAPFSGTRQAHPLSLAGQVIAPEQRRQMASHDHLWNLPDIYERAQRRYTGWRNFQSVRVPAPVDVAHWTYPLPLRAPGALNLYTLHDLVPLRLPYTTLDRKRRYLRLVRKIVACADHVVTVSECSRRDLINLLDVPADKVTNTYQAVSLPPTLLAKPPSLVAQELAGTYRLETGKYFLFVGAIEPKKNVGRLIQAYLASGSPLPLVLAGPRAWKSDEELRLLLADERRLRNRIRVLDYVPQSLLVSLMRGARALLFPSIYEGFGLPVLEAMLLGTPVLSATTGSIPEVAGDAALLVDPYDVPAMAEAIRALDSNAELRATLVERGLRRAREFSPERYRQRLEDLYARLLPSLRHD